MCEHPHVYTLGRSGKENNMLLSEEQLKAIDATLYHIDRGGDITYHGPGQLVCYPIHIQGQPVHSDIMTTPHSYRANLTGTRRITFQPDTRRFLQTSCQVRCMKQSLSASA